MKHEYSYLGKPDWIYTLSLAEDNNEQSEDKR